MLLINWGIRLLMAFVSAGVPCVCPYFCLCAATCISPAVVLKLFSTPSPVPPTLPAVVLYSLTEDVLCVSSKDSQLMSIQGEHRPPPKKKKILFSPQEASLGRPDWVFTRRWQVRVYTGLVPPPQKKNL